MGEGGGVRVGGGAAVRVGVGGGGVRVGGCLGAEGRQAVRRSRRRRERGRRGISYLVNNRSEVLLNHITLVLLWKTACP